MSRLSGKNKSVRTGTAQLQIKRPAQRDSGYPIHSRAMDPYLPRRGWCLGSAGNGEVAFSVRVDSAPFGAGIFKAFGVYRPMTFVLFGADGARVMSLRGHCKTDHFLFCLPVARFPRENLAPGSPKSDDWR